MADLSGYERVSMRRNVDTNAQATLYYRSSCGKPPILSFGFTGDGILGFINIEKENEKEWADAFEACNHMGVTNG